MLLITFGISTPFIFLPEASMNFFTERIWLLYTILGIVVSQIFLNLVMSCQMCCYCFRDRYLWMMKTAPWNFLYLTTFAASFGVFMGFICARNTVESVLLIFAMTTVFIVALSIYAVRKKADFSGSGAYWMVLFLGLLMTLLIFVIFPHNELVAKIFAGTLSIVFGFLIVYDTQKIFSSTLVTSLGGGARGVEYTLDMYAFAAWNLYLDFLNFFLYLLQLAGERR
eukprot:Skav200023  [mRNA]  locus=scaffold2535:259678:272922:- [translate_table: standard]